MRVPLIGTIDTNTGEATPFPAISTSSTIIFTEADGNDRLMFTLDSAVCMDQHTPNNQNGRYFEFKNSPPNAYAWEITCTNERITFWCPLTAVLFGPPKAKNGKCTAGHLYYKQIVGLSTGYIDASSPFFALSCIRVDGTHSHIMLFSKDLEVLRSLAKTLHSRISSFLDSRKLTDETVKAEIIAKWAEFEKSLWCNADNDIRFAVPTKGFEAVPNSRLSAM
jgi:hypothetical protein